MYDPGMPGPGMYGPGGGPVYGPPQYAVRAVPVPPELTRSLRRCSLALGLPTLITSLVLAPILLIWPYSLVPFKDPFRGGVVMFAGMAVFGTFGAGAMALGARTCVKAGYARITDVRVTRGMLAAMLWLSWFGALTSWGLLALTLSTPPETYRNSVGFDVSAWGYVLLLLLPIVLSTACFWGLRKLLWRSPYIKPAIG